MVGWLILGTKKTLDTVKGQARGGIVVECETITDREEEMERDGRKQGGKEALENTYVCLRGTQICMRRQKKTKSRSKEGRKEGG